MTVSPPTRSAQDATTHDAVSGLITAGAAGLTGLLEMLSHPSWIVRREVIAGLAALGDLAVPALCASLHSERTNETRIAATVDTLVASAGDADAAVMAMADDPDPAVVADVAQILGRRRSPRSLVTLIALTRHADDNVAVAAIEALGRVGGRSAVDALVACIESTQFFRVFPAIDVLGRSGDPRAVAPLAALLRDPRCVFEAARALGRTADRAAVGPLAALLVSGSDASVRVAATALVELAAVHAERYGIALPIEEMLTGTATDAAVRRVVQCLNNADALEREALCHVLGGLRESACLPALLRMLEAQPEVATAAAQALQKLGRAADVAFLDALARGGSLSRQVLLPLVGQAHASGAVLACLTDSDPIVRARACDALARIGDASVVSRVFVLLEDDNPRVVHAASGAIQALGSNETERLLLSAARSEHVGVRRAALRLLASFGFEAALAVFSDSVNDDDFRVREAAISGLAFLEHPDARTLLLATTAHSDPRLRGVAMRALGQSAPDASVHRALLNALADQDPWVRYYACQALGKLRVDAAAEPMAKLLSDEAGQVRVAAVEGLSHLRDDASLAALRKAAQSSDADVERAALLGLSLAQDLASLPVLLSACASPDSATRLVALSAAAAFASEQVLPTLATLARDADEGVRTAALGFLSTRPEREASRILIDLLRDATKREPILRALAAYVEARVPALLFALEDADDELAPLLSASLSRLQHSNAIAALFQALRLPKPPARKAAVTTLAAIGSREAYAAIAQLAASDPDPEVRRICALSLAQ